MTRYVIDASVALKLFVPEDDSDLAENTISPSINLHAPDFMLIEFDNVLCRYIRLGEMAVEMARHSRLSLRALPIQLSPAAQVAEHAFDLALETADSVYDCLYLALAFVLGCELLTADVRLQRRIIKAGLGDRVRLLSEGC